MTMKKTSSTILNPVITVTGIITCYYWLDILVIEWFYMFRESMITGVFRLITRAGESQWYLVGGLAGWIVFRKTSTHGSSGSLLLFSSVAASGITVNILKALLARARPKLYLENGFYGFDFFHIGYELNSFPSGHSATALSAASALAILFPRYRLLFYIAGFLVASSRVVLAEHYPGDVIAGSVLGYLTTVILYNRFFRQKMIAPGS